MISEPLPPTSLSQLGATLGLGCQNCELLELCGGVFSDPDCMGACHACDPLTCTMACPRSRNWVSVIRDAGGLSSMGRWKINQGTAGLPLYVPHIANGSGRSERLVVPCAAVSTFDVVRAMSRGFIFDAEGLRRHFRLHDSSEVISLSIEKDEHLERFWQYFRERGYAAGLAALGIRHVTAPNFSFALNAPRPEHLVNRSRSLRCAEQLSMAGLSVIVHLNAYNQTDWDFWRDFLREHSGITMVCLESQTGLARVRKAVWHISQLRQLEQSIGRGLHVLAVAGRRHLSVLAHFSGLTIIDSVPFIKTTKRRKLARADGKWSFCRTAPEQSLHELLQHNVEAQSELVRITLEQLKVPRECAQKMTPTTYERDPRQLRFWPDVDLSRSA
jgi:hypothetical protein